MKALFGHGALALILGVSWCSAQIGIDDVLRTWKDSPYANYPTQFTRDIVPKRIHSHNDYWRTVPLYSAISQGAISVEADVWLYNDTLYVGHDTSSLTQNRTFETLYVNPLVEILTQQNPHSPFVFGTTRNGVFDTSVSQTLFLFVDLKTSSTETFPYVVNALEPLRKLNYLTVVNGSTIIPGPVTVIGTGNTQLEQVASLTYRDFFFDGPLLSLDAENITKIVSPIASADFSSAIGDVLGADLSRDQLANLRSQVKSAHDKGIWVRYWDLPSWPITTRNSVWKVLLEEGVDLLNVDDLEAAANVKWWSRKK